METRPRKEPAGQSRSLTEQVKTFALGLGFGPVGITSADPAAEAEAHLREWIRTGSAASMRYMARERPRRGHPRDLLPEARSVICLAFNYYPGEPKQASDRVRQQTQVRIARYAVGADYHKVLKRKLRRLETYLVELGGAETKTRSLVDSAPILEREFARRAGIGFVGKNTHLITLRHGSWVFLAEVLTSLELETDRPISANCGTCTQCLDACPTRALPEPFVLDSRRCISYWTIEHRGPIPEDRESGLHDWAFGCDLCQEVCPFNHKAVVTGEAQFALGTIAETGMPLVELLRLGSDGDFRERFRGSPVVRPKREGILRNALTIAMNQKAKEALPEIQHLAESDPSEFIRELAGRAARVIQETDRLRE